MDNEEYKKMRASFFSAEMLVAYKFSGVGCVVSYPLVPCPYDLVVDNGKRLYKIQVKKASFKKQTIKPAGKGDRARYSVETVRKNGRIKRDEFDYLCVVCEPDRIYVIPTRVITSPDGVHLIRQVSVKPIEAAYAKDSIAAGMRYEDFRNNFDLD